jgi:hypothetical protein
MKIEEVANTFFKWRPSIFLMEAAPGLWGKRKTIARDREAFNESQCNSPKRMASVLR